MSAEGRAPLVRAEPPPSSEATLACGRRVASALLGIDAVYRKESGDETASRW